MIYKTMSGSILPTEGRVRRPRVVLTSRVGPVEEEELQRVGNAPCMFQRIVPCGYDLRVTVFGDELFPVEIHYTRRPGESVVDWRAHHDRLRYRVHDLPTEVGEKVVSVVGQLGLLFAAVDMVVTPEGEYVFLEVNPSGQWMWLERELQLGMTHAMARLLAKGQ